MLARGLRRLRQHMLALVPLLASIERPEEGARARTGCDARACRCARRQELRGGSRRAGRTVGKQMACAPRSTTSNRSLPRMPHGPRLASPASRTGCVISLTSCDDCQSPPGRRSPMTAIRTRCGSPLRPTHSARRAPPRPRVGALDCGGNGAGGARLLRGLDRHRLDRRRDPRRSSPPSSAPSTPAWMSRSRRSASSTDCSSLVIVVNGITRSACCRAFTTLEMVIAALMPTFVLFGWLAGRPATARVGSLLAIYTSVQLALDLSYAADFSAFANSERRAHGRRRADRAWSAASFACLAPSGSQAGCCAAIGELWRRGRRAGQRRIVSSSPASCNIGWRFWPRAWPLVPAETRSDAANLRQLRTALNIVNLRKAGAGLAGSAMAAIDALLDRLASACRAHTVGRLPDELLGRLDEAVASILREPASESRSDALDSLAGIRTGLFPGGAPYHPHEPEQRRIAA